MNVQNTIKLQYVYRTDNNTVIVLRFGVIFIIFLCFPFASTMLIKQKIKSTATNDNIYTNQWQKS